MAKKKRYQVYIYDPDVEETFDEVEVEPGDQKLRVRMEKKNRGGKTVTVISGYRGVGIAQLTKQLKTHCGVGGNSKEGDIILQGDVRKRIIPFLIDLGYRDTK